MNQQNTSNSSTDSLRSKYQKLNGSFKKTMIYRAGIDSGFFTEYSFMLHAMLYCLDNKIQFKLYSDNANFGFDKGWEDYFEPFCEQIHHSFHGKYNIYRFPSYKSLKRDQHLSNSKIIKWGIKVKTKILVCKLLSGLRYRRAVQHNNNVRVDFNKHFYIPELGIDGDYLQAFSKLVEITWNFNKDFGKECRSVISTLNLPDQYIGCQIRGGDKITETKLLSPEAYIDILRRNINSKHIFVLTDDYRLFDQLQKSAPELHWYTLCSKDEKGYVNKSFTETAKDAKRAQMIRFLSSMHILMKSTNFVGSITTAPSLFLLKLAYPKSKPIDCDGDMFPRVCVSPIADRGRIATNYMNNLN